MTTLHLKTQRNQPCASERRCCEMCGIMIWNHPPADGGAWTDNPETYAAPPPDYTPCNQVASAASTEAPAARPTGDGSFQQRVQPWLVTCFGAEIAADPQERNHRFLEEALELSQACGCSASEAHQLVDYVFGRPVGEKGQESGGVSVTHAALCLAHGLDQQAEAERELERIWTMVAQIRAKRAAKPEHSPLPGPAAAPPIQWPKERRVGRREDMSATGVLRVGLDSDNDVWVNVAAGRDEHDWQSASVEFCNGGGGGGRSPRTRAALINLMHAIEADNAAHPLKAFPPPGGRRGAQATAGQSPPQQGDEPQP